MSQQFVILITASPQRTQAHLTAIKYIKHLIKLGETISCVFFYQDAVLVANKLNTPPSDEPQLDSMWQELATNNELELLTCVAASYRRGVIDQEEAKNQELDQSNLNSDFSIAGLGQLSAALNSSSAKLIHFK